MKSRNTPTLLTYYSHTLFVIAIAKLWLILYCLLSATHFLKYFGSLNLQPLHLSTDAIPPLLQSQLQRHRLLSETLKSRLNHSHQTIEDPDSLLILYRLITRFKSFKETKFSHANLKHPVSWIILLLRFKFFNFRRD